MSSRQFSSPSDPSKSNHKKNGSKEIFEYKLQREVRNKWRQQSIIIHFCTSIQSGTRENKKERKRVWVSESDDELYNIQYVCGLSFICWTSNVCGPQRRPVYRSLISVVLLPLLLPSVLFSFCCFFACLLAAPAYCCWCLWILLLLTFCGR